jgi:hypothetical protein
MCRKAIYLAVALSCIMFLPLRVISQNANESNLTREAPSRGGAGRASKVAGPGVQTARHALGRSSCIATFEECRENLSEFKEAQQFMQLKAAVIADLNRLEESRHAKPKCDTVRGADSNYQSSGNLPVNRANSRSIGKSPAQAESAVLPVSLMSAGGSKP